MGLYTQRITLKDILTMAARYHAVAFRLGLTTAIAIEVQKGSKHRGYQWKVSEPNQGGNAPGLPRWLGFTAEEVYGRLEAATTALEAYDDRTSHEPDLPPAYPSSTDLDWILSQHSRRRP